MSDTRQIHADILEKLKTVIDPETGVDVVRMCLIEDLTVDENGRVSYIFRPSSPLCPIAVSLANSIQLAVAEVPGVSSQDVKVIDYLLSDELTNWLKQALEDWQNKRE